MGCAQGQGAGDGGEKEAGESARGIDESHVIPANFRGRWAEMPSACLSDNTRRYEISAIQIDRPDFSGRVEQVRLRGPAAKIHLETPAGPAEFTLAEVDENTMRAAYGAREPFTLTRCR